MAQVTELSPRSDVEVELKDGSVRSLRFTYNNFAKLEQSMAQTIGMAVFEALGKGSLFAVRQALWVALNDRKLTPDQVGRLMDPRKTRYYTEKILEALEVAGFLGEPEEDEGEDEALDQGEDDDI